MDRTDGEILNLDEAAGLFGVSIKTFIKLLKEEKVPARKIGREWRFSREALIDWISGGDSQAYSSSETETKEFFNKVAHEWDDIRKEYYDESISGILAGTGILKPDMSVVDIGAGSGYLAMAAAKLVRRVAAVDISGEMLKELSKKAAEAGITNIEPVEAEADDVPLGDSSVDVICSNMFLHHSQEPQVTIKEMHRLLKKGGSIFIADFVEHDDREMQQKMHDVWNGFSEANLKKWAETAGFKDIKINRPDLKKYKPAIFIMTAKKI